MVSTQLPKLVLDGHYAGLSAKANGITARQAFGTALKMKIEECIVRSINAIQHAEFPMTGLSPYIADLVGDDGSPGET